MRFRLLAVPALRAVLGAFALVACHSDEPTTPVSLAPPATQAVALDKVRREALTQQFAVSLADPAFRAQVQQALSASPIREHKLQFQRWMTGDPKRVRAFHGPSARPLEATDAELLAAPAMEFYFPVKGDLARWTGGTDLLVATTGSDREAPVAFDVQGRRRLLDPAGPPNVPVLALVLQETDFDATASVSPLVVPGDGTVPPAANPPGLYLTQARYLQSFEGWLKGDPEFDIHILGKAASKDSLTAMSCTGRTAPGLYNYKQTSLTWSGRALLYTTAQLDAYQAKNPGEGLRIFAVEDDDGACVMKLDQNSAINTLKRIEALWPLANGGKLTDSTFAKFFVGAKAKVDILKQIANFFLTNDDAVGNAVDRRVTGEAAPEGNWIIKGENAVTNGYFTLELTN